MVKLLIARQNFDAAEIEFADMLMEDHNNAALAYPDCALSALIISHRPTRTIPHNFDVSDVYIFGLCADLSLVHKQISAAVSRRVILTAFPNLAYPCPATDWFGNIPRNHHACAVVTRYPAWNTSPFLPPHRAMGHFKAFS